MGSDRVIHAFQRITPEPVTLYEHLVWYIHRSAASMRETIPLDEWQRRLPDPARDVARQAFYSQAGATPVLHGDQISPERLVTMGLFMPSYGRRIVSDYHERQRAVERLALWIVHHQRAQDIVVALYSALEHSTTGAPDHKTRSGWRTHWVLSEQFLHAVDTVFMQYSTPMMVDTFTWSQILMLEDLITQCANVDTMNRHHVVAQQVFDS